MVIVAGWQVGLPLRVS